MLDRDRQRYQLTTAAARPRMGRKITVPKTLRSVRDVIRQHLHEEKKSIHGDLARFWNVKPHSAYTYMVPKGRPLHPSYIEAVCAGLQLDEEDSRELHLMGAREAGWRV